MQEKDLKISYKILHFYPDLRGKFPLFLAKRVHFFPVEVEKNLRNLKVFFLRSRNFFTKFKGIFPAPQRKNTFRFRMCHVHLGEKFPLFSSRSGTKLKGIFPQKWENVYGAKRYFSCTPKDKHL